MLNEIYHSLNPIAFAIGPFAVRWYGLAYLTGFILTSFIIFRTARRWGFSLSFDDLLTMLVGVAAGVILGGRLGYVLFYGAGYYFTHPLMIFAFSQGGMSFHGGFVGALIGGTLVARFLRINPMTFADLAVIGAPSGLFLGRIANFINGELWGKPTDLPWGVVFEPGQLPAHPSQLYEAFLEGLVLLVILLLASRKKPALPQGSYVALFIGFYGVFRFLVEFVRLPDVQLGYLFGGWLTMGQILSLPLIIAGVVLFIYSKKVNRAQELFV